MVLRFVRKIVRIYNKSLIESGFLRRERVTPTPYILSVENQLNKTPIPRNAVTQYT